MCPSDTADAAADTDLRAREPGDYVEAWFRLTLNHPDTKAAAFVAMHVSRLVEERDELRARVEAARADTLNQAADDLTKKAVIEFEAKGATDARGAAIWDTAEWLRGRAAGDTT